GNARGDRPLHRRADSGRRPPSERPTAPRPPPADPPQAARGARQREFQVRHVAAIVLAAGASRRMDTPKQLITIESKTLVERAVQTARAAGCDLIIIVLGHAADQITPSLD